MTKELDAILLTYVAGGYSERELLEAVARAFDASGTIQSAYGNAAAARQRFKAAANIERGLSVMNDTSGLV